MLATVVSGLRAATDGIGMDVFGAGAGVAGLEGTATGTCATAISGDGDGIVLAVVRSSNAGSAFGVAEAGWNTGVPSVGALAGGALGAATVTTCIGCACGVASGCCGSTVAWDNVAAGEADWGATGVFRGTAAMPGFRTFERSNGNGLGPFVHTDGVALHATVPSSGGACTIALSSNGAN